MRYSFQTFLLFSVAALALKGTSVTQVPIRGPYSFCVFGVGDVDLDGVPDFYGDIRSPPTGTMYSGKTGSKLFNSYCLCRGIWLNQVTDVAVMGDINGDGVPDLLYSNPNDYNYGSGQAGSVYVYSGKDGSQIRAQYGANAGDEFGFSVCFVGDINNDKCDDYAVSIAHGGNTGTPVVYIYSGKNGAYLRNVGAILPFPVNHLRLLGDVNGSGQTYFVGTTLSDAYIFSAGGTILRKYASTIGGLNPVDAGLDVDGDGAPDFAYGSEWDSSGAGGAWVYSAKDGRLLHHFTGRTKEHLGTSVVLVPDLNGDGCAEILVGAPYSGGSVRSFSGKTGELMFTISEPSAKGVLGTGISVIGDLTGDGIPEVAIPRQDGVYIYDLQWGGAYGQGCGGATNLPMLRVDLPPRIGGTFRVEATNLVTSTSGVLVAGASDKKWGSTPLPLDLGVMGMKGCQLVCSFDVLLPFATTTGKATLSLAVPNSNTLLGLTVFDQLWALDASANPSGIATTNGVRSRVRQ